MHITESTMKSYMSIALGKHESKKDKRQDINTVTSDTVKPNQKGCSTQHVIIV
jgi:hypothetical protein